MKKAIFIIVVPFMMAASVSGQAGKKYSRDKETVIKLIESIQDELTRISDTIWKYAEVGFEEYKSSMLLADLAEKNGFKVERGISGMPTAFIASYGTVKPIIGITGEYDALPGLSQKVIPKKESLTEGGPGHGCGHNLIGTGALGTAIAIKTLIENGSLKGTIRYYGTPAEENYGGKLYLARDGYFDDLDICLNWHPSDLTKTYLRDSYALFDYSIRFHGRTAHASDSPWDGRSSLDAVESFVNGINLLREHVKPTVRMHYVITRGGDIPNVVPDNTEVWLWTRDFDMNNLFKLDVRIKDIAKGASIIAGVEQEVILNNGLYNVLPNKNGSELLQSNLELLGPVSFTRDEYEFACQIQEATELKKTGIRSQPFTIAEAMVDPGEFTSDMGDVSWIVPTITLLTVCMPEDVPLHSWGSTASFGSSIGHKGMIYASKVLALTMIDLYKNPDQLYAIKKEFAERKGSIVYKTMLPDGPPPVPDKR
ncbi:MAG: amidohydrolase [Bacteroidales bacterium]|nr:amidohydrolase [Bacteroidales bacterium]